MCGRQKMQTKMVTRKGEQMGFVGGREAWS